MVMRAQGRIPHPSGEERGTPSKEASRASCPRPRPHSLFSPRPPAPKSLSQMLCPALARALFPYWPDIHSRLLIPQRTDLPAPPSLASPLVLSRSVVSGPSPTRQPPSMASSKTHPCAHMGTGTGIPSTAFPICTLLCIY